MKIYEYVMTGCVRVSGYKHRLLCAGVRVIECACVCARGCVCARARKRERVVAGMCVSGERVRKR